MFVNMCPCGQSVFVASWLLRDGTAVFRDVYWPVLWTTTLFPTAALVVCVHDGHWDVRLLPVVSTTVPSDIFISAVVVAGCPPLSWFVLYWACTCQAGAPLVRCGDTRRRFFSYVVGHSCFFFGQINSELLLIKNKRIGYLFLTCKHFVYSGYNSFVECILEKYSLNRWHIGLHFS